MLWRGPCGTGRSCGTKIDLPHARNHTSHGPFTVKLIVRVGSRPLEYCLLWHSICMARHPLLDAEAHLATDQGHDNASDTYRGRENLWRYFLIFLIMDCISWSLRICTIRRRRIWR
jgi:hypothetical protein